jgi:hypothetical protein
MTAMTEQQWQKSRDIERMLECLVKRRFPDAEPCNWKRGERKKRLFVRACLERIRPLLPAEFRSVCELLESDADRQLSSEEREAMWSAAEGVSREHDDLLFYLGYDDIGGVCHVAARMAAGLTDQDEAQRQQASLLRDIFGNPLRPVAVDPAWLTPAVVELARTIYNDRAFDRMPALGAALSDAGCRDTSLLEHCSLPNHVKGCFLVDMLLGKE